MVYFISNNNTANKCFLLYFELEFITKICVDLLLVSVFGMEHGHHIVVYIIRNIIML